MLVSKSPAQEHPRQAIQPSRSLAWCSCGVHLLPTIVSIALVTINLSGLYCGNFSGKSGSPSINVALLQVAAKLQELLILASLTTIVVCEIRRELFAGTRIPLGILGGGFLYTSVAYFWSPAFWGSLKAETSRIVKLRLYGLLILCGIIAATAGPSSAVLMVPRLRDFDAGGGQIYLPGTDSTLWPRQVSYDKAACFLRNATDNPVCPSAGYTDFKYKSKSDYFLRNPGGSFYDLSGNYQYWEQNQGMPGQIQAIPDYYIQGTPRRTGCHSSFVGADLREAILLFKVLSDWVTIVDSLPYSFWNPSASEFKHNQWITCQSRSTGKVPAVRAACSQAQNLSSSAYEVQFPILEDHGCWNLSSTRRNITTLNNQRTDRIKTQWVSVSGSSQESSTGLVFQAPWDTHTATRVVVGCTVDARWAPGRSSIRLGTPVQSIIRQTLGKKGYDNSPFRPPDNNSWKVIDFHPTFLHALTPPAPDDQSSSIPWNRSTFEDILESMEIASGLGTDVESRTQTETWNAVIEGGLNRTVSLEWILAALVVNGLTRSSLVNSFDTSLPMHDWSPRYYERKPNFASELLHDRTPLRKPNLTLLVEGKARMSVQGYSFKAHIITDFLAVAVLLLYVCLAIWHSTRVIYTHTSSDSWETLTEFLALMLKSPPPKLLRNTGTGITALKTYATTARIHAVSDTSTTSTDPPSIEVAFSTEGDSELADTEPLSTDLQEHSHHLKDTYSELNMHPRRAYTWDGSPSQPNDHSASSSSAGKKTVRPIEAGAFYG